jgi:hypothetical protein
LFADGWPSDGAGIIRCRSGIVCICHEGHRSCPEI